MTQQRPIKLIAVARCRRCHRAMRQVSKIAYHCMNCDTVHVVRQSSAPIQRPPDNAA
ncbi:MAG: hypothetical protein ACRDHW_04410 [Ktedonobacteraceae bacterium]